MSETRERLMGFLEAMATTGGTDKLGVGMGFHLAIELSKRHPEYALALTRHLADVSESAGLLADDLVRSVPLEAIEA
jgi:hypothetical protein